MANPRGKFTFEGRNALVREQILKRLKSRDEREDTFTGPDDDGGAVYNYGCIETGGHGTVGDSLYAMKKLVYDEKKISIETLDMALKANFEGYDEVRRMLRDVPK